MKFISIVALVLPAMAAAQSSAPPNFNCQTQAGSYAEYCGRCAHKCGVDADTQSQKDCFRKVFTKVNGAQAGCQARGAKNCQERAINYVCGPAKA
ncbi:hypothetical protein FZEAL_1661 [Fusarium zealandicum]|uniref:Uncharacterized protein n=1 Tax=Fusarium zealandicum TaxID=1053134 RepID=A0A8H4USQ3_9HYPO|nr:hypothetical protein FZEAL_1661 [Fusarium zealandicum]